MELDTPAWRAGMIQESLITCARRDAKLKGSARKSWVMQREVHKEEPALAKGRDRGKMLKLWFVIVLSEKKIALFSIFGTCCSHGIPAESRRGGCQERNPTLSRTSSC